MGRTIFWVKISKTSSLTLICRTGIPKRIAI